MWIRLIYNSKTLRWTWRLRVIIMSKINWRWDYNLIEKINLNEKDEGEGDDFLKVESMIIY